MNNFLQDSFAFLAETLCSKGRVAANSMILWSSNGVLASKEVDMLARSICKYVIRKIAEIVNQHWKLSDQWSGSRPGPDPQSCLRLSKVSL